MGIFIDLPRHYWVIKAPGDEDFIALDSASGGYPVVVEFERAHRFQSRKEAFDYLETGSATKGCKVWHIDHLYVFHTEIIDSDRLDEYHSKLATLKKEYGID